MSLTVSTCFCLSLSISPYPMGLLNVCYFHLLLLPVAHSPCKHHGVTEISLTVPYGCWLSLTVSLVWWSCSMSPIVSNGCWLPLTVSSGTMKLLVVSNCLFKYH